ncbi:MAG TPA: rod shape-determining protein RodA [Candidatus Binatia bacterium]|nr:rod shape-determining protein RodA [Candidatus Binatia bacterium]
MIDKRLAQHIDLLLLMLVTAIISIGVTTVYSATYAQAQSQMSALVWRQALWACGGAVAMFALLLFDYRKLERYAYVIYLGVLQLLVLVPLAGYLSGGSRRWIHLGFFALQPSELAKLALVIVLARFFHRDTVHESYGVKEILLPAALCALPAVLTLAQPDLGSAAVMGFVFVSVVLIAGLRLRVLLTLVLVGLLGIYAAGHSLWSHLKPYQQKRILTFLNPESDPLGSGYHLIQSKIAVGSGMFWGKGFLHGTQNRLQFLPEQHTDFIFSVFAEEWGFVGCATLVLLYAALLLRGLPVVARAKDRFGALVAFGVVAMIFWQAFVNVAMTTGLLPVVGITLPFFSYGGSSMITLLLGVGLLLNVSMRRFTF